MASKKAFVGWLWILLASGWVVLGIFRYFQEKGNLGYFLFSLIFFILGLFWIKKIK